MKGRSTESAAEGEVKLRPATLADRRAIYAWMTAPDIAPSMMGPPDFAENPLPTWQEFIEDYEPDFFDGSRPERGRSFIIEVESVPVGHVSYSPLSRRRADEGIDVAHHRAELDIWMSSRAWCGRGYGSAALNLLVHHLHERFGPVECFMRPSARNVRAIRAYEKVGFVELDLTADEQTARFGPGEYLDTVTMIRRT